MRTGTAPVGRPLVARSISWRDVDASTHVATFDGEVVGVVDRTRDGHFVSRDVDATPIGRYTSLRDAKRSLLSTTAAGDPARRLVMRDRLRGVAVASGAVAGALALTAGAVAPFI